MMPGGFMGGAKDRLLPVSVPFRFFGAAAFFHVLAWLTLLLGAGDLPRFIGGPGPVLAALHLMTLGVLAMAAIGASYQLLPVATRQPLARVWMARLSFWLFAPGLLILALGMSGEADAALWPGAILASAGLLLFAVLTGDNLRRAGSLPIVAAHGGAALVALLGTIAAGLLLIGDFSHGYLADHASVAVLHMGVAAFGFMGLLVFGYSLILVPMYLLSRSVPTRPGWLQLGLGVAAILLFAAGRLMALPLLDVFALLIGLAAAATYLVLMRAAWKSAMRRRQGLSFVLLRAGWAGMVLGLLTGLVLAAGIDIPNGPALFGWIVLVGWLLTFVTGILQRIMPFLASMHATGRGGKPVRVSDLTAELPLRMHAVGHGLAFVLVALGIVLDLSVLVQLGAAAGLAGALAFAAFA
ncbi:MAG: hypothetical protein KDK00_10835, partial [Rhodobacteraceae bacterium]|nr:hypothetical protein [Paracoccaceae bacterium]